MNPSLPSSSESRSLDTIVAPASGFGRGDRALIRVSGPHVREVVAASCPGVRIAPGIQGVRFLVSETAPPLPCLLGLAIGPRSYTGEDTAEFVIPGNPALVERAIGRLRSFRGVREAEAGEFSARAYLNGKLSLDQAEGVAAVIGARTEDQLSAARSLLAGETGERYRTWAEEATTLLALVEAGIDFTDQEDVVPIAPRDLLDRVGALLSQIEAALGARAGTERLSGNPRVVLAGRPNSGKSTLFNALLGRQRALTSPVAGTTRDAISEELDLSRFVPFGPRIDLVDLAGLECAEAEIDQLAQEQANRQIAAADAIVVCDPSGRFDVALPGPSDRPVVRVRTKGDLPMGHPSGAAVEVCALDGWNLGTLKRAIADATTSARGWECGGTWLLPRHRRTLAAAAELLVATRDAAAQDRDRRALSSPEVVADRLRTVVDHLGELVGRISPDDVIGRIFATFCVGK